MKLRFLHLEDNGDDVELVRTALARDGVDCDILAVDSGTAYLAALQQPHYDAVLSDSSVLGYDGNEALAAARERFPEFRSSWFPPRPARPSLADPRSRTPPRRESRSRNCNASPLRSGTRFRDAREPLPRRVRATAPRRG